MANYDKRLCLVCGNEFEPRYASQVACTPECNIQRKKFRDKRNYEHKKEMRKLAAFVLEQQNATIIQLKEELAAAHKIIEELSNKIKELEAAQECQKGEKPEDTLKELEEKPKWEMAKPAIEAVESKESVDDKPNPAQAPKKSVKKPAPEHTAENTKKSVAIPDTIEMKYCERMKVRAMNLPCGERKECWENTPCEKTKGMEKPDFAKKDMKEFWKSFAKENAEELDDNI